MIVGCPSCQTRFELGDSVAHERRTRVRCSRCRHTFSLFEAATPAVDAAPQAQSHAEVSVEGAGADPEGRGELSDCFDAAVEEDRRESNVAAVRPGRAVGTSEPSGDAIAKTDAPEAEAAASLVCASSPGGEDSSDRTPALAWQDDDALESGSRGDDATAVTPSARTAAGPALFRVARPPQPQPVANLIGWLAVSLLCLVGLFRGL